MTQEQHGFYEFGPFRIDTVKRLLIRDQAVIPIAPKVFETLLALVRNPGRVLEKDELLRTVWSDSFVEEASLANSVSALRKVLGERPNEHTFVVTVPGRGYRFVAEVRMSEAQHSESKLEEHSGALHIESHNSTYTSVSTSVAVSSGRLRSVMPAVVIAILLVAAGLTWWLNRSPNHPPPGLSIVILPFLSMSGDQEIGHFSDGLTEQLRQALAVEPGFRVESRTAELELKGMEPDLRNLAGQLRVHVAAALKGSVQRSGNQMRVIAQMVDLPSGQYLWSETYELDGGRILNSQVAIAAVIVRTLRSRFVGLSRSQLTAPPTSSDTALKWYLKAQEEWVTQRTPSLLKSVEDYQKAISEDPTYAHAYAGLAASELFLASIERRVDRVANAKTAVQRALALNDRLADAHAVLGNIHLRREWNFPAAERELKRALDLRPGHSPYEYWYALATVLRGHVGEALAEMEIGRLVNPKSETIRMATGTVYLAMRQFETAETYARQGLALTPNDALSHQLLGLALEQQGKYQEAISELRGCASISHDSALCVTDLGHALALSGNVTEAQTILEKLDMKPGTDKISLALLWLGLKDNNRALDMLDQAYRNREPKLPWIRVDPRFDPLLNEPRFSELLTRIGFTL